ncbi:ABC transporter permease, partial [Rhizobium leguminosarum]|nr:ABC transporter permease [Rhizobium leguminosarum]
STHLTCYSENSRSPSSSLFALFALCPSLFDHCFATVPTERPTFLREYGNGMYGVTAYYLAKSTADIPFHIVFPVIGTTITYWMVHHCSTNVERL